MPFNGSGVFQRVRNWVADATAGIKIRADFHDSEDDGFATGLSNCIAKDGQTTITQNIPFNNKRITGLADPVNDQDATTKKYADTKLSKTGSDPVTGDLTIKKNVPVLILDDTATGASAGNQIKGLRNGKLRWLMRLGNGEAESVGNAGSQFDLIRYADDGTTNLGVVMKFDRVNGNGIFSGTLNCKNVIAEGLEATSSFTVESSAPSNIGQVPSGKFLISGDGTSSPMITFHHSGVIQANFGMGVDGNLYLGGGMLGNGAAYRVWTQRDGPLLTFDELNDLKARIEALEARLP